MKKMKKLLVFMLTIAIASGLVACGSKDSSEASGDRLERIKSKGYIVIATEGDWAPWTYHDESDALVGMDVELGKLIAEKLGVEVRFEETDWDSILAGVDSGRFDLACNGVNYTDERAEKYYFSTPYVYTHDVLVVRGDNTDITCFEDLSGKTTANTASSVYAQVAEEYGATVTPVNTLADTIQLLLDDRIDATINAQETINDYIAQHPDADLKIVDMSGGDPICIPVQKNEDGATLIAEIDRILQELRDDGTLAELSMKYFGTDNTVAE